MRFKTFNIRPTQPAKDASGNLQYEIVKWIDGLSCFVVGFLTRNKQNDWEFRSVGMRYFENWEPGLEKYIATYCDLIDVCVESEE